MIRQTKQLISALSILMFFAVCLPPSNAAAAGKVVLATLDWEPYIGRNLKNQGYMAVIVREAFRRSGIDVQIEFYQWSRVVGLAKRGRVDGYFPEYYAESITAYAEFSDPIPAGPLGFFKRSDSDIRFTTLEALKGYRIGIVKGYINTQEFDQARYLDKHPVKDDLTNIRLLLAGRIDLMVADKFVGHYLIRQHMPDRARDIEFLPKILEQKQLFVCISNRIREKDDILAAFNRGLEQMKADQTLAPLLPDLSADSDFMAE